MTNKKSLEKFAQTLESMTDVSEFMKLYRAVAKSQKEAWYGKIEPTQDIVLAQNKHLALMFKAPVLLTTPEQRREEEYLRRNMLDVREEMMRIRMSERYLYKKENRK
jgi:hypothetical protein